MVRFLLQKTGKCMWKWTQTVKHYHGSEAVRFPGYLPTARDMSPYSASYVMNLGLYAFVALTGAASLNLANSEDDQSSSNQNTSQTPSSDDLHLESPHRRMARERHLRSLPPRISGGSLEDLPKTFDNGDPVDFNLRELLSNILDIYSMNPKERYFQDMYTHDAVFEDPLMRLLGKKMIKFGFKGTCIDQRCTTGIFFLSIILFWGFVPSAGIEKGFKQSRTLQWHVQLVKYSQVSQHNQGSDAQTAPTWYKESHPTDKAVILWLHHLYEPKVVRTPFEMVTAVRIYLDEDGKIVRHEDLFYGVELSNWSNSGILGALSQMMRFVNGYIYCFLYILFCDLWE